MRVFLHTFSDVKGQHDLVKKLKEKDFPEVRKWVVSNLDNDTTVLLCAASMMLYIHALSKL